MDREEAIKIVRENMHLSYDKGNIFEALETLIPELRESENERVRQLIYSSIKNDMPIASPKNKELALSWLEKQKDASKAIEAVDRIDKYIDKHLANAHDMKDSDPDKKYYRGWDDALGKMSGILQDVYSGEKQKEHITERVEQIRKDLYQSGYNDGYQHGREDEQKEQIPYTDFVIKPHKGDDNNPYDMRVSEAQEYAIKRGFGVPFNDGEVYVDERHITQTIGNILRWADDHPKEQKPAEHGAKGRRGRLGGIPEHIRKKAEAFRHSMEPPYDADDICSAYETGAMENAKPAWSEEDEEMRKRAICACNFTIKMIMREDHYGKARDWLKSLPIGFITNPNYNSNMIELLVSELQVIANKNGSPKQYDAEISWLKSLRPQWRPSEEQMKALDKAIPVCMGVAGRKEVAPLESLYNDLKKLI